MKKAFYIMALGLLGMIGFTSADITSLNVTPTTQSAISGSSVTFTITGTNTTGAMYLKYVLPQTATYTLTYQNANITPINDGFMSRLNPDPIFAIPANSNFSVTITAKLMITARAFSPITTTAAFGTDQWVSTALTSAVAQIMPIADLIVTNVLTGENPSISGDIATYSITIQNIGSANATGISFMSNFPISMFATPTATFNNTIHPYSFIDYLLHNHVWTGNYLNNLNAGDSMTILLSAPMTQNSAIGTSFSQIASAATASAEHTTGNNSATATGAVQAAANVWITKTLAPFTGYKVGDEVMYTITYGNNGGKTANNVTITDIVPAGINIPTTSFTIGTLPAGSGGTFVITGTLGSLFSSGQVFANTARINTTSSESATGDNRSTATGTTQGIANVSVNIIANNITKPQLDNVPYGSGPATLIQAISGDMVQLTITYANFGNTVASNGVITLAGIQGLSQLSTYNGTIGTLPLNSTGTIIITGIVGPKNYVSFTPTVTLTYNTTQSRSDAIIIQEPMICGDGVLTRTETCDTAGNIGVAFSGQVCENQQGMCVLVTQAIINNACVNYQYANPLGGIITGQSCSSVNTALMNSTCSTLQGSDPVATSNGYDIDYTCKGNNTTATTPIIIDCGNGTSISGSGAMVNGTCRYSASFNGNAQCRVGNDTNNTSCRLAVSQTGYACDLEALDGRIVVVDADDGEGEGRFRCDTHNNVNAQITIDCGTNGKAGDTNNQRITSDGLVSQFETTCNYDIDPDDAPQDRNVQCYLDTATTACEDEDIILDKATFGRCGDGERDGREQCDGTDGVGEGETCNASCYIEQNTSLVGCFNISNANLSVQENEFLPFRWNVDVDTKGTTTCNSSNTNKVDKDSLMCTFEIYNKDGIVDTITRKCKSPSTDKIFNYFSQYNTSAYGRFTTLIDDAITNGIYGEYKIRLAEVNYDYCDGNSFVEGTPIKRVCETNFTVTKPYLIQKSSFGLTPKATTEVNLDNFYGLDDEKIVDATKMDEIMIVDPSEYASSSSAKTLAANFVTKYEKIAVKYKTITTSGGSATVYKVPSKDIMIFKGNGTLVYKDGGDKMAPFTVIVDGPNLAISGSITKTNGMFLVTKGDITFLPNKATCTNKDGQIVQGIFIAQKGSFAAGPDLTNNNTNDEWCAYGGLHVKGILIGDGIQDLVKSRRSQLNHRFTVGGTSETARITERRNEIFNGASLLIEYSPSLWSALPPGASDFTKALDVYKQ